MVKLSENGFNKSRQGFVKCLEIKDGQFPEEFTVTLDATIGQLIAIFPSVSINVEQGTVNVSIIAEKEDEFLVDLPTYTFSTASKVWFSKKNISLAGSVA